MRLQTKIIALISSVTLLVMIILDGFFYLQIQTERFNSVADDISHQLQHINFTLNTFFTEVKNDIETLAGDERIHTPETTFAYSKGEAEQNRIDIFDLFPWTMEEVIRKSLKYRIPGLEISG